MGGKTGSKRKGWFWYEKDAIFGGLGEEKLKFVVESDGWEVGEAGDDDRGRRRSSQG